MDICENQAQRDVVRDFSSSGRKPLHLSLLSPTAESRKVTTCFFCSVCDVLLLSLREQQDRFEFTEMSFLKKCLPPVKWVVRSMCEGEDGRVHQLPHPRVPLLLAGAEAQVGDLLEWSKTINRLILELIIYNSGDGWCRTGKDKPS